MDGMLVHRRVIPSIKFAGTHLYTWVERGTVRVKCLAQEHNTMSPARARSGDERTNHEATAPPGLAHNIEKKKKKTNNKTKHETATIFPQTSQQVKAIIIDVF